MVGALGSGVSLTISALDQQRNVRRDVLCIDGVFVTDFLEHLHVLFVRTCALAGLSKNRIIELGGCSCLRVF